jgi:hypothetical protein
MREGEAVQARAPTAPRGIRGSSKLNVPFVEIRRGGKVNLLPRTVVVGSVCIIEFLLVALIGFGI